MPKLSNEWRTTSKAINCLLEFYKDMPEFRCQLNELRAKKSECVTGLVNDIYTGMVENETFTVSKTI